MVESQITVRQSENSTYNEWKTRGYMKSSMRCCCLRDAFENSLCGRSVALLRRLDEAEMVVCTFRYGAGDCRVLHWLAPARFCDHITPLSDRFLRTIRLFISVTKTAIPRFGRRHCPRSRRQDRHPAPMDLRAAQVRKAASAAAASDLWPIMTIRDERKAFVYLTDPYRESESCLLVRADRPYPSVG